MSTSPETEHRVDDHAVTLLSQWLTGHMDTESLARSLDAIDPRELATEQATAFAELLSELQGAENGRSGAIEMIVRETLEAIALGAEA